MLGIQAFDLDRLLVKDPHLLVRAATPPTAGLRSCACALVCAWWECPSATGCMTHATARCVAYSSHASLLHTGLKTSLI